MPKGKPFICWISSPGHYHDVACYIGDEIEFNNVGKEWVRAKVGCKRSGRYVARYGKNEDTVWFTTQLRPISNATRE